MRGRDGSLGPRASRRLVAAMPPTRHLAPQVRDNNPDPVWVPIEVDIRQLCSADEARPLKLQVTQRAVITLSQRRGLWAECVCVWTWVGAGCGAQNPAARACCAAGAYAGEQQLES